MKAAHICGFVRSAHKNDAIAFYVYATMSLRDEFASLLTSARAAAQEREDNECAKQQMRENGRDAELAAWARDFLKQNMPNIKWVGDPRGPRPAADLQFTGFTDRLDDAVVRGKHIERALADAGIAVVMYNVEQESYDSSPPQRLPFSRVSGATWMGDDGYGGLHFIGTTNERWHMTLQFSSPR